MPKAWLLCNLTSKSKAGLETLIEEAAQDGFDAPPGIRNNAERRAFLTQARSQYWDRRQSAKSRKPSLAADLCQIPASECNEWLRTLPRRNHV